MPLHRPLPGTVRACLALLGVLAAIIVLALLGKFSDGLLAMLERRWFVHLFTPG